MSKYGFVNKPIKTSEAEWDRIFPKSWTFKCRHCGADYDPEEAPTKCPCFAFSHQTWMENPNEITVRIPEERPANSMRQIEYADILKDSAFGPMGFPEDGKGLPIIRNHVTGEHFEVLSVLQEKK